MRKIRLAILASGNGSNAESIMKWAKSSSLVQVVCVGCNKKEAKVLDRALSFDVPSFLVLKKKNETKENYDLRLIEALKIYSADWIILAGYMRLLSSPILEYFHYQVINIHPSLLPAFPGLNGYGDAYQSSVTESGCTVHYVDEGLDSGTIIAQKKFLKIPGESFFAFKQRGLAMENQFYPEVLEKLFQGKHEK